MRYWIAALSLCVTSFVEGSFDYAPWFSRDFELQPQLSYRLQHYREIDSDSGNRDFTADDCFYTFNLGVTVLNDYNLQVEFGISDTKTYRFLHLNHDALLLRYQLYNSDLGDPFSLAAGLQVQNTTGRASRDVSVFNHCRINAEVNLAIGFQDLCEDRWMHRSWALAGFGTGDTGSPWVRAEMHYDWQPNPLLLSSFGFVYLQGLGCHSIHSPNHFQGYYNIRHRSFDVEGYLQANLDDYLVKFSYAYRLRARNCPRDATQLMLSVSYPFGL